MCFATAALGIVGAVASAAGSLVSGEAQAANANYQAQVARNNAQIEQYNQVEAANAGRAQAERQSEANAGQQSAIRAALGASNVDVNTGSAENVQQSQREIGELGTETTYQNALLQVYGYKVNETSDIAQGQLYSNEAAEAPIGGMFGAAGSLFKDASAFKFGNNSLSNPLS